MWYRILLPELLADVERVLYLDVDTLALDTIAPLWRIDLSGHAVAAVTNVFEEHRLDRPATLRLPGPEVYFNSGVLLMNLDELRRTDAADTIRRIARERGAELVWPDQDVLNLALWERRLPLRPRWNVMNSVMLFGHAADVFGAEAVAEAREHPAIRHFEGPGANKPWDPDTFAPHAEAWRAHLSA
jgi:lipopolysaccharide biosynthesis glycosyltransferase